MMLLTPDYRVLLNRNVTFNPLFFEFLKQRFNLLLAQRLVELNLDLSEVYRFTLFAVPAEYNSGIVQQVALMDAGLVEPTDKLKRIGEILHSLDPIDPHPVDIEFVLADIISFVKKNLVHFTEVSVGGVLDYFGINYQTWFDDYPIQTGTVLRAVDFGTLENYPHHLFDGVFVYIREHILDLFAEFNNQVLPKKPEVTVTNVDVQEL